MKSSTSSNSTAGATEGTHSFNLQVGKNGAPGNGNLERTGIAEVTASTTEIAFEWIQLSCTIDVLDTNTYSLGCIPPDSDGDGVNDADDLCPDSDLSSTIVINGDDTGVENCLLDDGCTLADLVAEVLANDPSTAGIVQMLIDLKAAGLLTGQEMGSILQSLNSP